MSSITIVPVILCGGSGTRLWPLSRALMPKQLLRLAGTRSLLEETYLRTRILAHPVTDPLVICNEGQRFLIARQLAGLDANPTVVLEPEGRNTAPAVAVAALLAKNRHGAGALLLVMPSDHVIRDQAAFAAAVSLAVPEAIAGQLVTFGIVPERPETGYGYIRARSRAGGPQPVAQFIEKPDYETARRYVQSGDYYWNSGMFLFSAGRYLEELDTYAAEIRAACEAAVVEVTDLGGGFRQLGRTAFLRCPGISLDYAVMEKTDRATVVPLAAGWSDIGSWAALHEVSQQDSAGNAICGDILALDCRGSYLRAESRFMGAIGLEGTIVIETADAILVAPKERAQDVKVLVDELKRRGRPEVEVGREVIRPWGSYDSLESRPGFQVKRLAVLPGAVLSLQAHRHRAEHWVVVTGLARITRDGEVFELRRNEHTFIPVGARHRIENPGTELLQIIEVQIGDYLGEDDIVRYEDKYGRAGRTD